MDAEEQKKRFAVLVARGDSPHSVVLLLVAEASFHDRGAKIAEDTAKVPGLSAFYAGFNPRKCYRPVYTGNVDNIKELSDFLAHKAFENWKRSGDTNESSNAEKLEIRMRVYNPNFVVPYKKLMPYLTPEVKKLIL